MFGMSVVLAGKYLLDGAMTNKSMAIITAFDGTLELNRMESYTLSQLNWKLYVNPLEIKQKIEHLHKHSVFV